MASFTRAETFALFCRDNGIAKREIACVITFETGRENRVFCFLLYANSTFNVKGESNTYFYNLHFWYICSFVYYLCFMIHDSRKWNSNIGRQLLYKLNICLFVCLSNFFHVISDVWNFGCGKRGFNSRFMLYCCINSSLPLDFWKIQPNR